ncbi:hypothetical protein APA_3497 [Pseudanabaena sp. lw0831]|uniref:hypothetical protein n=1 Tax=Pseudanabaena sp. lw0831 TaxID=1357935 RepID=UPI001915376F|nr:hypothetical protein [Pseudanabaena sp. lw0831]GBO51916.1 hypothetical protein APA_3497 [Pseudanabaena sp. lw0831]
MEKVINKISLKQQTSDFQYWQQQTPQKRLEELEQIRQEYHQYKYNAHPRFQRVYTIINLDNLKKKLASGRLQDLADLEKLQDE